MRKFQSVQEALADIVPSPAPKSSTPPPTSFTVCASWWEPTQPKIPWVYTEERKAVGDALALIKAAVLCGMTEGLVEVRSEQGGLVRKLDVANPPDKIWDLPAFGVGRPQPAQ